MPRIDRPNVMKNHQASSRASWPFVVPPTVPTNCPPFPSSLLPLAEGKSIHRSALKTKDLPTKNSFKDDFGNSFCVFELKNLSLTTKTTRRTFFRACVFTIFLPHIWNGFIFFCGFYKVFLVPCIVMTEMLSFTMVTKFNYFLIWKLHRFVLYEVVSKASRGSLLQQWFIRFLVFFQSNVFRKRVFFECSECIHRSTLFFRHCVAFTNLGSNGQWQAPNWSSGYWTNATAIATWNTGYITGLDMCKVCTEAVHSVALWTRVTLQVWTCVKYVPKQSIA